MSKIKEEILSDLLKDLLKHIGQNKDKLCDKIYLTGFLGIQGKKYGELDIRV